MPLSVNSLSRMANIFDVVDLHHGFLKLLAVDRMYLSFWYIFICLQLDMFWRFSSDWIPPDNESVCPTLISIYIGEPPTRIYLKFYESDTCCAVFRPTYIYWGVPQSETFLHHGSSLLPCTLTSCYNLLSMHIIFDWFSSNLFKGHRKKSQCLWITIFSKWETPATKCHICSITNFMAKILADTTLYSDLSF